MPKCYRYIRYLSTLVNWDWYKYFSALLVATWRNEGSPRGKTKTHAHSHAHISILRETFFYHLTLLVSSNCLSLAPSLVIVTNNFTKLMCFQLSTASYSCLIPSLFFVTDMLNFLILALQPLQERGSFLTWVPYEN